MTTCRLPAVAFSLLTSVFLIAGIMASPAHASPTPNTQGDEQPVSTNAPELYSSRSSTQEIDTAGYWTEERMRSAIPAEELIEEAASKAYQSNVPQSIERSGELGVTGGSSYPVHPKPTPGLLTRNPVVPATTGKVFFTYKGKNYVCSGSVINGVTKNVVSTAGHCVHGGKGEGWRENIAFALATITACRPMVFGIGQLLTHSRDGLTHQIFLATKPFSLFILAMEEP